MDDLRIIINLTSIWFQRNGFVAITYETKVVIRLQILVSHKYHNKKYGNHYSYKYHP